MRSSLNRKYMQRPDSISIKLLLVLLLFLSTQIAEIFHLIEHKADGEKERCEICYAAVHTGNAPLPEAAQASLPPVAALAVFANIVTYSVFFSPASYASRAPPLAA